MMTFCYCCAVATAAVSSAVCVPKRLQKKERENVIKYAEQKKLELRYSHYVSIKLRHKKSQKAC